MPESSPSPDVPLRVFESLLRYSELEVDDALLDGARAAGFDVKSPRDAYPAAVWRAVLELVRSRRYPALSEAAGMREVGRVFVRGFAASPVGWVFGASARLLGPERVVQSIPRYLHAVRRGMQVATFQLGPGHYRLDVDDVAPSPDFIAGCLEAILHPLGLSPTAHVLARGANSYSIELRWEPT